MKAALIVLIALTASVAYAADKPQAGVLPVPLCDSQPHDSRECRKVAALTTAKLAVCAPPAERSANCQAITDIWFDAMDEWRKVTAGAQAQTQRPQAR